MWVLGRKSPWFDRMVYNWCGQACVYLFVLLTVECLSEEDNFQLIRDYVVTVVELKTGHYRCMGGIVTRKAVITSCSCVGSFVPPDLYDFVEVDPNKYAVKRSWVHMYSIEKSFAHLLCRPSSANYTVNDLGGWIIRGLFNPVSKGIVPFFARTDSFERIEVKIKTCYITSYINLVVNVLYITSPSLSLECLQLYVHQELRHSKESEYFLVNAMNDALQCGFVFGAIENAHGSPILCAVDREGSFGFFALGIISWTANSFALWTRFDLKGNREFYLDLVEAGTARIHTFHTLIILILAKINPQVFMDYTVTAVERLTGKYWCMGGIVSSNVVLTSCTCIGTFKPPVMFDFLMKDLDEISVKTVRGKMYDLEKAFVHRHCRPTIWNYTVNDLGGWMIKGGFNENFEGVLRPVFSLEGMSYKDTLDSNWRNCFVYNYNKRYSQFAFSILSSSTQLICLDQYCTRVALSSPQCFSFQTAFSNDQEICATYRFELNHFIGSPLLCRVDIPPNYFYVVYGVVGYIDSRLLFWTRLDTEENEKFFNEIVRGGGHLVTSLGPLILLLLLNHTISIFQ